MVSSLAPGLLAFVIAGLVAVLELVTTPRYSRTFFVLTPRRCWALYAYGLIYGVVALLVTLGLNSLIGAGSLQLQGLDLSNPWVQAMAIGLTVKAFLHVRLFNATVGSQSVPIGIETLVQLFEPWLLRTIEIDLFNGVRDFLNPRAQRYSNLNVVRQLIKDNVPESLPEQERVAFLVDIERKESVLTAMEAFLRFLGKTTFDRVFPP